MKKLLIANRGEIACRVIRAAQSLGVATVAIYSEADAQSLHVTSADEALPVGPAKAAESYLNVDNVLDAAVATNADAIHPGYGFLSENADFAAAVEKRGLVWVGPTPEDITAMGDKERARRIAADAGVPVLPGSPRFAPGANSDLDAAAEAVGYPLLVKASAGGGGIGMRIVEQADQLAAVVEATQTMAQRSFNDGTIFLERYIPKARHIEIQVFGFGDGRAAHLYERECSIQRRFQKVIEEAPATNLPASVRDSMVQAALALTRAQQYRGAGTVEFIVDASNFDYYFLEMNTRIQVEHPVTEMVTGVDLVAQQLRLADGETFSDSWQQTIMRNGHAIECRIYAENPAKMFLPSPGTLERFELPSESASVRVDTGVRQGDVITPYYDPMIAKIICAGDSRADALDTMREALGATKITGIANNVSFLHAIVDHGRFRDGDISTSYIDVYGEDLIS